jgi:NADH-quinone oxidoreductase subunit E
MCCVSEALDVPLIEVFRLANFYKSFSLKPRGRHLVTVCTGTACHVQGAPRLVEEIAGQLEVKSGETTLDGSFTLETVNCVGACALAPLVIMDAKYFDHVKPAKLQELLEEVRQQDREVVVDA